MIAVYAYTHKDHHYKPLNEDFFRLAKLSVKSSKKYYKTRFYCDEISLKLFNENEVFFDEVVMVSDFVKEYPTVSSISKIYAMMHQQEPYLLLDFDTILLEKISSTHTITYGHPEVQINEKYNGLDTMLYTFDRYIKPFNDHVRKYFTNDELLKIDWLTYPSFCIVMVKTPLIMKNIYDEIFNMLDKEVIKNITSELLEQFLSHQKVLKYKVDYGFLSRDHYENGDHVNFNVMNMITKKYVHLNINNSKIKDELIYLENTL